MTVKMTLATRAVLKTLLECGALPGSEVEIYQRQLVELSLLSTGTVSPMMRRLADAGMVTVKREAISPVETGRQERIFYQLTEAGVQKAREAVAVEEKARARWSGDAAVAP